MSNCSSDLAAIRKCFRRVDADGSGTIDDDEWNQLVFAMEEFYGFAPSQDDLIELSCAPTHTAPNSTAGT